MAAFVDGEAYPERRAVIEAWLANEPADAARVRAWQNQNDALRAAFGRPVADPISQRPAASTAQPAASGRIAATVTPLPKGGANQPLQLSQRFLLLRREQRARMLLAVLAAFVAGALVACLAAISFGISPGLLTPLRSSPTGLARPMEARLITGTGGSAARRAIEAFVAYAPEADSLATAGALDGQRISDWLELHFGRPLSPARLAGETTRFLGAYVTPGDFGPAAFLLYVDALDQKFGLAISRNPLRETATSYAEDLGFNASVLSRRGLTVAVVGAMRRDRLLQLTESVETRLQQAP